MPEAGKTGFGQVKIMKEFFEYKENISKFGFRASRWIKLRQRLQGYHNSISLERNQTTFGKEKDIYSKEFNCEYSGQL